MVLEVPDTNDAESCIWIAMTAIILTLLTLPRQRALGNTSVLGGRKVKKALDNL